MALQSVDNGVFQRRSRTLLREKQRHFFPTTVLFTELKAIQRTLWGVKTNTEGRKKKLLKKAILC